ncbi:transmembrane protease serine 11D-like [Cydia fagiglandana]|uniref:transmembrane protease serine 11D-like n=1 Tax=Cydia fagiglandana TaxID=1458189 RepID=UPI002FEE5481
MTKFAAIILIIISSLGTLSITVKIMDTYDVNHEVSDRIFTLVDDLFISLKINQTLIQPKNIEEYMIMQNFVQGVLRKNYEKHKEMHNNIKTNISDEMADQITGVNEVIEETIREHAVTQNDSSHLENKPSLQLEYFADLTNPTKEYNVTMKKLTPKDYTLWNSNSSQEVDSRRIFKGSSTGIARYPFMVSVHVGGRFVCAGSLLHESLALSAASCLMPTRDDANLVVQIRFGSDFVTKLGYLVNIDRIFFHPEFDSSTLANNLVILKTRKALRFQKKKVVAVKYDRFDQLNLMKKVKDITILGWGRRGPSEKTEVEERPLSRARLNIYDLEECKYIYTKEYVSDKNFCAGFVDRGEGACNHDGGGPALAGSLLTGVISFGSPKCGRVDSPTVFTRIGLYADWIDRVLDSVAIADGKLANPHTFQTPSSIDVGVPSAELDKMTLELENSQEVLQRGFSSKDILNGPIDKQTNGAIKPSIKENEHLEIPKHDATRTKITDVKHSEEDQIRFSDDFQEHLTVRPERPTLLEEKGKVEDAHDESAAFTNFIETLFVNGKIVETDDPGIINSEEYEKIDILDFEPDTTATTAARPEHYNEKESSAQRSDVARDSREVQVTQMLDWDLGTNDTSKETTRSLQAFDVQYEIDVKPISIKKTDKTGHNKSIIILSNSGTTQRISIKNTDKLNIKLTKGIKDLIEHINDLPLKNNGKVKKTNYVDIT